MALGADHAVTGTGWNCEGKTALEMAEGSFHEETAAVLRDSAYVGTSYASAGLEFMPIRSRDADGVVKFAIGLRAEIGYVASTSAEMHANPDHGGGGNTLRIATAPASLGSLDASGRTYRIGLVGRF